MIEKFNIGDKVVKVCTSEPIMTIKRHPTYASGLGQVE
jgi:hypothetical protein